MASLSAIAFSFAAAAALAASAVLSKRLTLTMPARQLVGPLLLINALLVAPAAAFGGWVLEPRALLLHLIEALLLTFGSLAVWDLYDHGAPSAAVTAQSLSPIPAVIAVSLLLPEAAEPADAIGAMVVVAGVLLALTNGFPGLGNTRRWITIGLAASTAGVMTVTSRLLAEQGVGVAPTYVARALVAALLVALIYRPRDVPIAQLPQLILRSVVITIHFIFILVAVRLGSPAVVQSVIATSPLLSLGYEAWQSRSLPAGRTLVGTLAVTVGIAMMAMLGS